MKRRTFHLNMPSEKLREYNSLKLVSNLMKLTQALEEAREQ